MKQWLLMIFLILSVFTHAQKLKLGATGNVGFSTVSFSVNETLIYDISPRTSISLGGVAQLELGEHSFLLLEAKWTILRSHESYKTTPIIYSDGSIHHDEYAINEADLSYSSVFLPLLFRQEIKKLGVKGGFLPVVILSRKKTSNTHGYVENEYVRNEEVVFTNQNFGRFNMGLSFGVDYSFTTKWRARLDSQIGLQNMMVNPGTGPFRRKYKQFTIGVDYFFN